MNEQQTRVRIRDLEDELRDAFQGQGGNDDFAEWLDDMANDPRGTLQEAAAELLTLTANPVPPPPVTATITAAQAEAIRRYLDFDADEHIRAHGHWSLDMGKLMAALGSAGVGISATHQIVDFGPGPDDRTQGYPFEGTEAECAAWTRDHQENRPDGQPRYGVQEIPPD